MNENNLRGENLQKTNKQTKTKNNKQTKKNTYPKTGAVEVRMFKLEDRIVVHC